MRSGIAAVLFLVILKSGYGQRPPEEIFMSNIRTVTFNLFGDPTSYPIISLVGGEKLELDFDDMDGGVKYYYYTLELRNADWSKAQIGYLDYVKGFTQQRINTYRQSSAQISRYTHYQVQLPDRNLMPFKSGNYVLKVFLNGDTSKLAFTRRLLVVDNRLGVAAQIQQPFAQQYFRTHHRLLVKVSTKGVDVRYPQQQIRVNILQNFRWDNAITTVSPTYIRPDMLEFVNEQEMLFPAMREWRWLNLRSFRLLGETITSQENTDSSFVLNVKEETPRVNSPYYYFSDMNGLFVNETTERINPLWEAEYAKVHFSFVPPNNLPYRNSDLYVFGKLTGYGKNEGSKLSFNQETGKYEGDIILKQGYYDYVYALHNRNDNLFTTDLTEGNVWETEDAYLILVYYRELGGRYDQLLGMARANSLVSRPK